jgi:SAM-dependent methyltransferase
LEPVFDEQLVTARRRRAARRGPGGALFLMERVAAELAERLAAVERRFELGASLFSGTGHAAAAMRASGRCAGIVRVEADAALLGEGSGIVAPPDRLPLAAGSLDLAASLLFLQETNDTPGLLVQIRRALRPDGLFLGALAGAGSLAELRDCLLAAEAELYGGASPRVAPLPDVREMGDLLQRAGFALPVVDVETLTVRYASAFGLMDDLRAMGAANALAGRSRQPVSRRFFLRAAELYAERYADPDGRVRATFNVIWLSGWAPHESQQRPARRGSGLVSLAEVLENRLPREDRRR